MVEKVRGKGGYFPGQFFPSQVDYGRMPSDVTAGFDTSELPPLDKTVLDQKIRSGDIQILGANTIEYEGIDVPLTFIYGPLPEGAAYYEVGDLDGDGELEVYTARTEQGGGETIFDVRTIGTEGVSTTSYNDWASENIDTVDESEQITEQDAKKILSNIFGSEDAVPQSAFTGILGPTGPLMGTLGKGCSYSGTPKEWEWWRQCVSLHVLVPILGLPELPSAVLGGILQSTTIGEIEDALRNINKKISDVFSDPEYTWEDAVGDLGEWVQEKVDAAGDILDPSGITIEDVLGTLGGAASSIIIQGVVNEVKDTFGIPVFLTTDEKCQAAGTKEDPDNPGQCLPDDVVDYGMCDDNLTKKLDQDGTNCPPGQSISQEGDDCFTANDEAGTITNVGGELKCVPTPVVTPTKQCQDPDVSPDANGRCPEEYCADGTTVRATQPFGICPEDQGTTTNTEYTEPTVDCENPKVGFDANTFDPTASAKYASYSAKYDAECAGGGDGGDGDGGTSVDTTYIAPTVDCENPKVGFSPSFDPTARAKYAEYSQEYDATCLGGGGTTSVTPTFTVVCGEKEPYAPTGNALAYNAAYREYEAEYNAQCLSGGGGDTGDNGGEEQCSGGKVRVNGVCECPAGTTEIDGECVSVSGPDDNGSTTTTTFNCISQNRQTNEDGSCGACLPGYSPDPNNFDQCVKDDTVGGGEPPGPTTETPPPATSSGGGGVGGGGAGGMFTGTVSGISYAPQALPGIQTPAPVNAMASLEGLIGRMLTGNIS